MDFEAAIGHRLPQVLLHGQARLCTGIHLRLEEAMGAAALGLGAVHREIRMLDQLIQIGAVLRRKRDADRGIGREMMAEALTGLPDRVVDARHEFHDVGSAADGGLDHGELVAAEPCDQVRRLEAILDAPRHGLQELVTDMMPERIVDALELVDVDIKQRKGLAARAFSSSRSICSRNSTRFGRSVSAS